MRSSPMRRRRDHGRARVINPASRRVLEKCGFAYQGAALMEFPARGGLFPVDLFLLARRVWQIRNARGLAGGVPQARPVGGAATAAP